MRQRAQFFAYDIRQRHAMVKVRARWGERQGWVLILTPTRTHALTLTLFCKFSSLSCLLLSPPRQPPNPHPGPLPSDGRGGLGRRAGVTIQTSYYFERDGRSIS